MFRHFFGKGRISSYFTLSCVVLISTFVLWLPFLLKTPNWLGIPIPNASFDYIYRHYDGLLYVVPAKTLYNPALIEKLRIELPLSPGYFAAHFPLYPLLIRLLAPGLGYLKSMLVVNLVATIGLAAFFYYFLRKLNVGKYPLYLTIVFLFFPRFLVVRSIGAPESLFLLAVLASLYFFEKGKYWWAGVAGALAVTTRSPGLLLLPAYFLVFVEQFRKERKIKASWLGILLIPAGFVAVFLLYGVQYHDMFAYFKSGDNFHLAYPFAAFNYSARWVGTAWLEEILFYFFIYLLAVIRLKDHPQRSFFYFGLVYFVTVIFIQHQDIGRYSLPLWPLAIVAFHDFFERRDVRWALLLILPAIYLYAWNFMATNVMPVSDWSAYL